MKRRTAKQRKRSRTRRSLLPSPVSKAKAAPAAPEAAPAAPEAASEDKPEQEEVFEKEMEEEEEMPEPSAEGAPAECVTTHPFGYKKRRVLAKRPADPSKRRPKK